MCGGTVDTSVVLGANIHAVRSSFFTLLPFSSLLRREMAWSYCWRYACMPERFYGRSFTASLERVARHNIPLMAPAQFDLITLTAPGGMTINVTLYPADAAVAAINLTSGTLVRSKQDQPCLLVHACMRAWRLALRCMLRAPHVPSCLKALLSVVPSLNRGCSTHYMRWPP